MTEAMQTTNDNNDRQSLDGLLVVDKPGCDDLAPQPAQDNSATAADNVSMRLLSSHDVVARVRRWSGQKRIGHTGTLDPMASGLLLLCLGKATRLAEFYQHQRKRYRAVIVFGAATDTDDATGRVIETAPTPTLDPIAIQRALASFLGDVEQQAPLYSAIKQQGEALYRRVRRGETVAAPVRAVAFYAIDLVEVTPPDRITLEVECSAGAYIRSLARDLGRALRSAAYLQALRRTRIGEFRIEEAHSLAAVEQACREGRLTDLLLPVGERLPLPAHRLDDETLRRLGHGQVVSLIEDACDPERRLAIAKDRRNRFIGVMRRLDDVASNAGWRWKAEKWLG
ncbi:MAG: tRNA pseudouridine(55) synthase TruB [Caldilinea sp.]|nr:tRNA pseudouridine(55) synthase TruB [Caldilinea sp.]MDW8441907.1 tRNA pseudouridine(55) synthase TruB [Caldilineaceae bacterium]